MLPTSHSLRLVAVGAAAALTLTACGSPAPGSSATPAVSTAATPAGATRTITDIGGEVTIPVEAKNIVALDELAALNLMSIGLKPAVAFNTWHTVVPRQIIESQGVKIVETTAIFPELEQVAALKPDLIVGSMNQGFLSRYPDYGTIAPTVRAAMQTTADSPESIVEAYGRYFGREAEAKRVTAALNGLAQEVAAKHAEKPMSLSALMAFAPQSLLLHMDGEHNFTTVIKDAGFTRPELQTVAPAGGSTNGGWTAFAPETLPSQDADVLVIAVGAQYPLQGVTDLPLYSSLSAVQNNRSVPVDGDIWAGGSAFYEFWALQDLQNFAAGEFKAGGADDAAARWTAFQDAIAR